jgi:hypothetical protein
MGRGHNPVRRLFGLMVSRREYRNAVIVEGVQEYFGDSRPQANADRGADRSRERAVDRSILERDQDEPESILGAEMG